MPIDFESVYGKVNFAPLLNPTGEVVAGAAGKQIMPVWLMITSSDSALETLDWWHTSSGNWLAHMNLSLGNAITAYSPVGLWALGPEGANLGVTTAGAGTIRGSIGWVYI